MVAHGRFSKETFEGVYRALPVVDKFGHMKDANAPSKVKFSYSGNHGYLSFSDVLKRATESPVEILRTIRLPISSPSRWMRQSSFGFGSV